MSGMFIHIEKSVAGLKQYLQQYEPHIKVPANK